MPRKTEFHAVEFFRKVRDEQAAALAGKSPAEIVAFFSRAKQSRGGKRSGGTRRQATRP